MSSSLSNTLDQPPIIGHTSLPEKEKRPRVSKKLRRRAKDLEQEMRSILEKYAKDEELAVILEKAIKASQDLSQSTRKSDRDTVFLLLDNWEGLTHEDICDDTGKAIMAAIGLLTGGSDGFFGNKSTVLSLDNQFAGGGHVSGPGTGTSDSIPALLSNGEFVIRAASARRLGTGFLNFINNVGRVPALAGGGFPLLHNMPEPNFAGLMGGGGNTTNNFQFARPEDSRFRLPSRAAFRDAARKLRGK